ncbi:MAG: hypothetical protein ACFFC7_20295 [Candidatus Hermodarchaeota archaeon]
MAGNLPFLDDNIVILILILILLTSIAITNLAFYRYFKYEKTLSALVTAIGFLLITIFVIVDHIDSLGLLVFVLPGILPPGIFYDNNLGGLDGYIFLIGLVVLLIGAILRIIREE